MSDLKVEILLPLYYNVNVAGKRTRVEGSKYIQTYDEIFDRFGGCSIEKSPLLGSWINPATGREIKDENVTYWVMCKNTKQNRRFFASLKRALKKRFLQNEILMYYIQVHRI